MSRFQTTLENSRCNRVDLTCVLIEGTMKLEKSCQECVHQVARTEWKLLVVLNASCIGIWSHWSIFVTLWTNRVVCTKSKLECDNQDLSTGAQSYCCTCCLADTLCSLFQKMCDFGANLSHPEVLIDTTKCTCFLLFACSSKQSFECFPSLLYIRCIAFSGSILMRPGSKAISEQINLKALRTPTRDGTSEIFKLSFFDIFYTVRTPNSVPKWNVFCQCNGKSK